MARHSLGDRNLHLEPSAPEVDLCGDQRVALDLLGHLESEDLLLANEQPPPPPLLVLVVVVGVAALRDERVQQPKLPVDDAAVRLVQAGLALVDALDLGRDSPEPPPQFRDECEGTNPARAVRPR